MALIQRNAKLAFFVNVIVNFSEELLVVQKLSCIDAASRENGRIATNTQFLIRDIACLVIIESMLECSQMSVEMLIKM